MKLLKIGISLLFLLLIVFISLFFYLSNSNNIQTTGTIKLKSLKNSSNVIRDAKGMAYVHAENMHDLMVLQGFITAQDRIFQMHMLRLLASGRISEIVGQKTKDLDIKNRTLGFYRLAQKHVLMLDKNELGIFKSYAQGVNDYMEVQKDNLPLEFSLTKLTPQKWRPVDSVAIMYFMGWGSAANMNAELRSQMLIEKLGAKKFNSIKPIFTNPDDLTDLANNNLPEKAKVSDTSSPINLSSKNLLSGLLSASESLKLGSNNWAVGSAKSVNNTPVVVNDPHLSTSLLPTSFYPMALILPNIRAVGVTVAGIPSLIIGRNNFVALGVTNSYGDSQDVFIETLDPNNSNNYLEGSQSLKFKVLSETLKIKDKSQPSGFKEESFKIKLTNRGPVISNVIKGINGKTILSLRWAAAESMQPSTGLDYLLKATSVSEVKESIRNNTIVHLNMVFADIYGNIGYQTTGRIPIRKNGNGATPNKVNKIDNWVGFIPYDKMPQKYPELLDKRGWVGTANHNTVNNDYPYYYSSFFAPRYRYQRVVELLDKKQKLSTDQHWQYMRDDSNMLARSLTPTLIKALKTNDKTLDLANALDGWNFRDQANSIAPTIFHNVYRNLAVLIFKDELGEEELKHYLSSWYLWQERMEKMVLSGSSEWFDNINTEQKESLTDLIVLAGLKTKKDLSLQLGSDKTKWLWGKTHVFAPVNSLRRSGLGKEQLGGGTHSVSGSGETIYRMRDPFFNPKGDKPNNTVKYSAALRMVVDLSDNDKVIAVLPGGVSGRTFNKHYKDQIPSYVDGTKEYWWFSDQKIQEHSVAKLNFVP